jgi:hypothetical protein
MQLRERCMAGQFGDAAGPGACRVWQADASTVLVGSNCGVLAARLAVCVLEVSSTRTEQHRLRQACLLLMRRTCNRYKLQCDLQGVAGQGVRHGTFGR